MINHNVFDPQEVEKVMELRGMNIIKSLTEHSPFEEKNGWIPNSSVIVINQLIQLASEDCKRTGRTNNLLALFSREETLTSTSRGGDC